MAKSMATFGRKWAPLPEEKWSRWVIEEMNRDNPQMMPALLRIARNTPPEELAKLAAKAERQSQEKGKK